jgi:hypothetical protein
MGGVPMKNVKNIAFLILWVIMLAGSILITNKLLAHTEIHELKSTNGADIQGGIREN